MTEHDLDLLTANIRNRVELTCVNGETISGEVVTVSASDVLLDGVCRSGGAESSAFVLSVEFTEIASVRPLSQT
jgi:hypothetical protein